ncbi:MAG: anti-toxin [Thiotrichales bacterium]|nr:MAG: anti-toxin [Thiotrichales bacterium]
MLAVRLSKNLENRLSIIAQKTGRTKTYYVTKALEEFLEDREDYLLALQRLEENNPRIGLEQARKLLEDIEQNTSANKA